MSKPRTYLKMEHMPPRPLAALWLAWAWEVSRAVWNMPRGVWDGVVYVILALGGIASLVEVFRSEYKTPKWEGER